MAQNERGSPTSMLLGALYLCLAHLYLGARRTLSYMRLNGLAHAWPINAYTNPIKGSYDLQTDYREYP